MNHSIIPQILPGNLLPDRHRPPLPRHQWLALPPAVLVCQESSVLDADGVGAGVCGVGAGVPESAEGEC